jgi:uncharacterized protein
LVAGSIKQELDPSLRGDDRLINMDKRLLEILACPICKGKLQYDMSTQQLICKVDKVAFSIRNNIPIMLIEKTRKL